MKAKLKSSGGTDKNKTPEERVARIDRNPEERRESGDNDSDLTKALEKRAAAMAPSDDEDEHESVVDDDEWDDDEEGTKTPDSDNVSDNEDLNAGQNVQDPQSFHKERSESPDSDYGSDDNVKPKSTSPSHPAPDAGKPLVPPRPDDLQARPKVPPVKEESPVSSEMKDSFPSSVNEQEGFKKLTRFWKNQGRT